MSIACLYFSPQSGGRGEGGVNSCLSFPGRRAPEKPMRLAFCPRDCIAFQDPLLQHQQDIYLTLHLKLANPETTSSYPYTCTAGKQRKKDMQMMRVCLHASKTTTGLFATIPNDHMNMYIFAEWSAVRWTHQWIRVPNVMKEHLHIHKCREPNKAETYASWHTVTPSACPGEAFVWDFLINGGVVVHSLCIHTHFSTFWQVGQ